MKTEPTYQELKKMYEDSQNELLATKGELLQLKEVIGFKDELTYLDVNTIALINALPIAITISDIYGNFQFMSEFGLNRLGYSNNDIETGLNVKDLLVYHSDFEDYVKKISEPINSELPNGVEYLIEGKNNEKFYALIFSKIVSPPQKLPFMLSVVVDHTNFRKVDADYIESEQKLREINASKDKFFSIIAHDLKNPFNTILGFSELLLEEIERLEKEQIHEYVKIMYKSATGGMNLLTNLLNWSLSQINKIEFKRTHIDLALLLEDNFDLIREKANQKRIELVFDKKEPVFVFADKNMLDTVLRNLISNAVKFTSINGKVEALIETVVDNGEEFTKVTVSDSGIGISKENLSKLFKIEEHFSTRGTHQEKGTGLGLLLCCDFIDRHKGEISAESVEGEGSRFFFTIPCEKR